MEIPKNCEKQWTSYSQYIPHDILNFRHLHTKSNENPKIGIPLPKKLVTIVHFKICLNNETTEYREEPLYGVHIC